MFFLYLKNKSFDQTKICFATRKRRIYLKGTIFIFFNFRLSWNERKLFQFDLSPLKFNWKILKSHELFN